MNKLLFNAIQITNYQNKSNDIVTNFAVYSSSVQLSLDVIHSILCLWLDLQMVGTDEL